jgi:hypothetical protein
MMPAPRATAAVGRGMPAKLLLVVAAAEAELPEVEAGALLPLVLLPLMLIPLLMLMLLLMLIVAAEPVVVAGAAPLVVAAAPEVEAVAEAVHEMAEGTLTPLAWQICWAKEMALAWSAASHLPSRQQAMLLMKSLLLQMHFASVPQPLYPLLPLNWSLAHDCCARVR